MGRLKRIDLETTEDASDLDSVYIPSYQKKLVLTAMMSELSHGAVKILKERIGELANLPNPEQQARSVAAILAKKYRMEDGRLGGFCALMRKREFTLKECQLIGKIVEDLRKKHGQKEGL